MLSKLEEEKNWWGKRSHPAYKEAREKEKHRSGKNTAK